MNSKDLQGNYDKKNEIRLLIERRKSETQYKITYKKILQRNPIEGGSVKNLVKFFERISLDYSPPYYGAEYNKPCNGNKLARCASYSAGRRDAMATLLTQNQK